MFALKCLAIGLVVHIIFTLGIVYRSGKYVKREKLTGWRFSTLWHWNVWLKWWPNRNADNARTAGMWLLILYIFLITYWRGYNAGQGGFDVVGFVYPLYYLLSRFTPDVILRIKLAHRRRQFIRNFDQ